MNLKLVVFIIAGASILLVGCSDPKNYEVTKLTDDQRKELGQKLTSDEGQKLARWMMRNAMSGKDLPVGVTVGKAVQDEDEWEAKQKAEEAAAAELRKKVQAERRAKVEEFAKMVSVALVSKRDKEEEYGQKFVYLDLAFENKTDKDIEGIKGVLKINDIFGDKIQAVRWSYDGGVAAGKTAVERGSGVKINQFVDNDMKLWNTDADKVKGVFETETIIFKDGSRVEAPDAK